MRLELPRGRNGVTSYFLFSAATILAITGGAKVCAAFAPTSLLTTSDPITGLSFGHLMFGAGFFELVVVGVCMCSRNEKLTLALVAWLTTVFLIYRIGFWWVGWHRPCHCLGNLTDALQIQPQTADTANHDGGSMSRAFRPNNQQDQQEHVNGAPSANGDRKQERQVRATLSPRQVEIAELLLRGYSDKEISTALQISEETVGWHLKRMFIRCSVHSRAALTARFMSPPPHERGGSQTMQLPISLAAMIRYQQNLMPANKRTKALSEPKQAEVRRCHRKVVGRWNLHVTTPVKQNSHKKTADMINHIQRTQFVLLPE